MEKINQKGMTLVEVYVACSVIVLLTGIISIMVIKAFAINRYTIEQGLNTASVQNSLAKLSKHLREARQSDNGGYLVELADDFDLVFFANVDDDPAIERVHYYLQNSQLKIGTSEASGFPPEYPDEDQTIKIIGNGIINNAIQPVFYYYGENYYGQVGETFLTTPVQPSNVSLIKIDLFVNTDPNNIPENTRMETFVRPRNIE